MDSTAASMLLFVCLLLSVATLCQSDRVVEEPGFVHDRQVAMFQRNAGTPEQRLERFPPHEIVGNLYYVGTRKISSFLVTSPAGHILINSTLEAAVPTIRQSVEELGFDFERIEIILASHAHFDHMQGDALVKQLTGASVMVMAEDVLLLSSDPRMNPDGKRHPLDHVLHDGEEVTLGGTTLVARRTPGHTPGSTTWVTTIEEDGEPYRVVIVGSMGVHPDFHFVDNPKTPDIVEQFRHGFAVLRSLAPDIPLASHPAMYGMAEKYARLGEKPNPFVDKEGYTAEIDAVEALFHDAVADERRAKESRG